MARPLKKGDRVKIINLHNYFYGEEGYSRIVDDGEVISCKNDKYLIKFNLDGEELKEFIDNKDLVKIDG